MDVKESKTWAEVREWNPLNRHASFGMFSPGGSVAHPSTLEFIFSPVLRDRG